MNGKKDEPWEVTVTVLIPRDQAPTDDDAVNLLGQRLKPWYWTAQLPMPVTGELEQRGGE